MNFLLSIILFLVPNLPIQQVEQTTRLIETATSTSIPTIETLNSSTTMCSNIVDISNPVKEAEERIEQERLEQERLEQERLASQSNNSGGHVANNNYTYNNSYSYDNSYSEPSYTAPSRRMGNWGGISVGGYYWALDSNGFQDIVDRGDCWVGGGYPMIFGAHNYTGFTAIEYCSTATWYKPDGSVVTLYKVWDDWNAHNYYTVQKSNGEYYYDNPSGPICMYTCTDTSGNNVYMSYWTY